MKKSVSIIIFQIAVLLFAGNLYCQDINYPKEILNNLASRNMCGRGYVKSGDAKAAAYISSELDKLDMLSFDKSYFQEYSFAMNTFPKNMKVILDKNELHPVYDYVVAPDCKTIKGEFKIKYLPSAADTNDAIYDSIIKIDYSGYFVVADFPNRKIARNNPLKASGVIVPKDKIHWWVSTGHTVSEVPVIVISASLMKLKPHKISVDIKNKFIKNYKTQNIIAYIKGAQTPDSFLVFTAHYDHLGMMGYGNIFCGANDNASGSAMLLWLAKYFSLHRADLKYSAVFMFFSGEETGLLGSKYYIEHPLFPLSQIKYLINLDMVGTGSEGISIVNGKKNSEISNAMIEINKKHNCFTDIKLRDESCNSDHCFFDKAGVPAIFIFTRGSEFAEYHNLDDVPEDLPLTKFSELKNLLIEFVKQ